jgi:hypothetical protein
VDEFNIVEGSREFTALAIHIGLHVGDSVVGLFLGQVLVELLLGHIRLLFFCKLVKNVNIFLLMVVSPFTYVHFIYLYFIFAMLPSLPVYRLPAYLLHNT